MQLRPVSAYEEGLYGLEIRFNGRAPSREQHEAVARMLARRLLEQSGFYPTDAAAAHLARALMLPLDVFIDDLQLAPKRDAFDWLKRRHVYASGTLIGARASDAYAATRRERRHITA